MALKKQKNDFLKFRQIILDFPSQFRIGINSAQKIKIGQSFNNLIICGMGGSALAGDILKTWFTFQKINLPICVQRDYELPYLAKKQSLIICISYSGNTEETIAAFKEAQRKKLNLVAICSGGRLEKLCQKANIPLAKIPLGFPPRMTLGFQLGALVKILSSSGIMKDGLKEALSLEKTLKPRALEDQGEKLAKKLENKIPLIYSSSKLRCLAKIWKIKFNENAKTPAFYNYFPELNHNEMVGFTKKQDKFRIIILRDTADHPRIKKRMKLLAEILKQRNIGVEFVDLKGNCVLYRIFNNIILSDWTSYYLALKSKINPWPVKIVEEFKLALLKNVN